MCLCAGVRYVRVVAGVTATSGADGAVDVGQPAGEGWGQVPT